VAGVGRLRDGARRLPEPEHAHDGQAFLLQRRRCRGELIRRAARVGGFCCRGDRERLGYGHERLIDRGNRAQQQQRAPVIRARLAAHRSARAIVLAVSADEKIIPAPTLAAWLGRASCDQDQFSRTNQECPRNGRERRMNIAPVRALADTHHIRAAWRCPRSRAGRARDPVRSAPLPHHSSSVHARTQPRSTGPGTLDPDTLLKGQPHAHAHPSTTCSFAADVSVRRPAALALRDAVRQAGGGQPPARHRVGEWPWWLSFFLVLLVNYAVINIFGPTQTPRLEVSYTFFKQQVAAGNVSGISSRGDTIQGTFAGEVHYSPESEDGTLVRDFSTVRPAF
jgi:hypothetical protein